MRILTRNIDKDKIVKEINTGSQVCAIEWEMESRTMFSAHGFSKYQICLWDYKSGGLLYEFMGHKNRILSLIRAGEGGNTMFSASADETLRVWNMDQYVRPLVCKKTTLCPTLLR